MSIKEKKIQIVDSMVCNGYALFNETAEQFADRFDLATLEMFASNFVQYVMDKR